MKKLIAVLIVLALIAAGLFGYLLYQTSHFTVEDTVYSKWARELDLRGTGISVEHYETVRFNIPDCQIIWDVPLQGYDVPSNSTELLLRGFTAEDQKMLRYFTDVKTIVLSDCNDYSQVATLQAMFPQAELGYNVDLGGKEVSVGSSVIGLQPGEFDYDVLMENLQYLPNLNTITFMDAQLTPEQFASLKEAYPAVTFDYSVMLLGIERTAADTELDLTGLGAADLETVIAKLPLLAGLQSIRLTPETEEKGLTLEQAARIKKAAPQAKIEYAFELYGQSFTTDDETMVFKNQRKAITDETLQQLRYALDVMNNCTKVTLDNTGASNEACAQLREDYRGKTEVVWRVYFADYGTSLTDVEVLRVVYDLVDDNCDNLKYLEKVRYMDLGHNEYLDYCDFVAGMPELEVAIISGAPIHSLEPFANCKKLKFLEIANCIYLPDLEPLRNCTELEMLNISHTEFTDLSPLDEMDLTHLCMVVSDVSEEERLRFEELHPDCWITWEGAVDYGVGWRYDEKGEKLEWYAKMADAFHYPHPDNKTGWYLS